MMLIEIKEKAKNLGIQAKEIRILRKVGLIRLIQETEGNVPCFGISAERCEEANCAWRDDCVATKNATEYII